jgi:serine/arginine repetitive matrix protein 2
VLWLHRRSPNLTPSYGIDGSRLRVDRDSESVQELTPTIRTINPPPLESPVEAHPRSHLATNESANDTPLPPPKPQDSPPRNPRMSDTMSFLQTPPRSIKTSDSANFEFQSPSPPKGLPELPGPPSMSDEEEEDLVYDSIAWEQTPGQSVAEHADVGNVTDMKTPRPPGAWLATPTPADNVAHTRGSPTVSSETEYDGGLATPVASLSRASALQTPLPPGAWMPTPATARKSILRVRFEQPPSESTETEQSISSANSESSAHSYEILKHSPSPANKATQSAEPVPPRSRTPDLQMPVTKPQSPRSPRKSPKIRVMDAFGREAPDHISREVEQVDIHTNTPRTRSAIRIMDAMGREVDGEANKVREDGQSLPSPLNRREALMRVRQGLSDLAEGIDEINRSDRLLFLPRYLDDLVL